MSIYELLHADHEEVAKMLAEIQSSTGRAKTKLFNEMKTALTAHLRAEEKVFYSLLKEAKRSKEPALEGFEEHHVADMLLRELSKLSASDERWDAKFKVLKENVEHHVEEEESEIWAKAREVLSDEEAEEAAEKFTAEKEKRLARLAA
jgi:hemerythrin superfamily protein